MLRLMLAPNAVSLKQHKHVHKVITIIRPERRSIVPCIRRPFPILNWLLIAISQLTTLTSLYTSDTHNLQAALVDDCSSPGAINVTGIFAKNSTAMGYFVIVSSSDNNKPEQFVAVVGPTHDVLGLTDRISNLSKGVCLIALYDIEGDGLPNTAVSIHSSVEISDGSSTGQLGDALREQLTNMFVFYS